MIKDFLIVAISVVIVACRKDVAPTIPLNDTIDTTMAELKYDGDFVNGPYGAVSGSARIYRDSTQYTLSLVNMMISNGPDLHVYLSKEKQPADFIDLGRLRSTSGNQVYPISAPPDLAAYSYVLIHCQKYNHLFGSAAIK